MTKRIPVSRAPKQKRRKHAMQQARFASEYCVDLNATQAAIRAGYSPKTAKAQGTRLLTRVAVRDLVAKAQARVIAKVELTAENVLEEMRRLAFSDPRGFFDEHGNLKPINELTAEQASALGSFEVIIKNAEAGDGKTDTVHKIKLWDKTRILEMLGKHFSLIKDQVEVTALIGIMDESRIARLSDDELVELRKTLSGVQHILLPAEGKK